MKFIIALACVCISGSAIAQPSIPPEKNAQADQFASTARETLDNDLADYPSARFRNVRATYSPRIEGGKDRLTFCGELNAKNHMGGYTGWASFALLPEDGSLTIANAAPISEFVPDITNASVVARFCSDGNQVWLPTDYTSAFAPKP